MSNIMKNKPSSGLDRVIAGVVSIVAFLLLAAMLLNGKNSENFAGSLFTAILLTVLVWFVTLKMLYTDPKIKEQNEKLEQQRIARSRFVKDSKAYVDESFLGIYVGGSGNELKENTKVLLGCSANSLYIGNLSELENIIIPHKEITLFEISGEGTVTTNAGIVGGGFGVEGFIKGAVVAEIVNKATTKTSTNTFMRLMTGNSEMYFHISEREPAQLQILFSKIFVLLNASKNIGVSSSDKAKSIGDELIKLHSLFKDGVLTEVEFEQAKKNLISC